MRKTITYCKDKWRYTCVTETKLYHVKGIFSYILAPFIYLKSCFEISFYLILTPSIFEIRFMHKGTSNFNANTSNMIQLYFY